MFRTWLIEMFVLLYNLSLSLSLSPCTGIIICNLPKTSICWDAKHEKEAISEKWKCLAEPAEGK